jgi:gliding motility-associated-like protein
MAMRPYRSFFLLFILLFLGNMERVCAQAPAIVAKPGPIVLHLDATGNYKVQLSDLATISGAYNSVSLSPANFSCSDAGSQTVIVNASNSTNTSTDARLNYPYGIASDALGNIYVADAGNNQIKKITPGGVVTVFAGSGNLGAADGQGTAASFARPWGLTMDGKGNIYVADAGNNLIRMITPSGVVSTIAGSGSKGANNGISSQATFNNPAGVAVDKAGNVYVVDSDNNLIRKITPGGIVSTFAGNGQFSSVDGQGTSAGFYDPHGIAIDNAAGLLYIADGNNRIRKIDLNANVTTFAGNNSGNADGVGTMASFYFPIGITIDKLGNLYISDTGNDEVREVTAGGLVTTIAGNGSNGSVDGNGKNASINAPIGITLDPSGNLYVTEGPGNIIRKIDPAENVTTLTLVGSNGTSSESSSLAVNVTVLSQPAITSTYNNVTVTAYRGCSPVLPDYTATATASDNCPGSAITFTQSPVAGTPLAVGEPVSVILTATDESGAVTNSTFDVNVISSDDSPVAFAANPTIFAGSPVQLEPIVSGDVAAYSWSPSAGLSDPTIKNPIARPAITTTYTLTVTTAGGCTFSSQITINVLQQVIIPNAFTPNGDGINDLWNIAHLSDYPACTVDIYNRGGELMYHSIGYGRPWEGTYKGNRLPSGTYYYVIDLKDGQKKLSGQVTIIK